MCEQILQTNADSRLTDVISITVRQTDAHVLIEQMLQIEPKIRIDEVSRVLESIVNTVAARVIKSDAKGLLHLWQVEIVRIVRRRRWVVVWVAYVVDPASAVVVVWRFDVITAHVGSLVADLQHPRRQLSIRNRRIYMVVARIAFS